MGCPLKTRYYITLFLARKSPFFLPLHDQLSVLVLAQFMHPGSDPDTHRLVDRFHLLRGD
ncbi:MAG: hypothetical protein OXC02_03720 [Rhodobacteraceae bacterium]|nr:hypothetical protein [Paracoccaceae bacterium]